jgi:hypothetical protein
MSAGDEFQVSLFFSDEEFWEGLATLHKYRLYSFVQVSKKAVRSSVKVSHQLLPSPEHLGTENKRGDGKLIMSSDKGSLVQNRCVPS